ncbi:MAG: hypothetical protein ACREIT_11230, partial [Tepidisphaeraceae bacterium]
AADVGGTVSFQREQQMWDMTNELAGGHTDAALRRWQQLVQLDSSAEFRAVTWLTMWLENVRKALRMRKAGVPDNAIANQLRIFPFDKRPAFFKTINAMGESGVSRTIDLLAQIDKQTKSGVGEASTNVERFILTLAAR